MKKPRAEKSRLPLARQVDQRRKPYPSDLDDADKLKADYENGDALAPFKCCWRWAQRELPSDTLPTWVTDHLVALAAAYFERNAACDLDQMTSLEELAGITGPRGSRNAWRIWSTGLVDQQLQEQFDEIVAAARDPALPSVYVVAQNTYEAKNGKRIAILNRRGEPRHEFLNALAADNLLPGRWGNDSSRTMKRRIGRRKGSLVDKK